VPTLGDARPLYDRVYRALRSEIENGTLRAGDLLPSERTIAEQLQVSRVTVRRALQQMTEDGLLDGRRVASIGEDQNALVSFSAMSEERGLEASSRVLVAERRDATIDQAEQLQIPPGASLFVLHRVRLLGGVPVAIDESAIPYERVKGIEKIDFTTASLYETLERRFRIVPTRTDYVIEAVAATRVQAKLLQLEPGAPVLRATEAMHDQLDRPTDVGCIVYRGDRYRFRATLTRRPS
jgi:GntR family transcriptional regulator